MAPNNSNIQCQTLKPNTHLELALVTNRCEEALCSAGDVLLAVTAYF